MTVTREALHKIARYLHDDPAMDFDYIVHVSSVDWPDDQERFEVVWEFYSIRKRHRIRLKTRVPESDCVVDSLTDIWQGANFMEREVYDMMGIRFRNHPDLRGTITDLLIGDLFTERVDKVWQPMESLYQTGKSPIPPWRAGTPGEELQGKANELILPDGRRP